MNQHTVQTGIGTLAWSAPEVLLQKKQTTAVDVWSFGVICWELLTERVPYAAMAPGAIVLGVVRQELRLGPEDGFLEGAPPLLQQLLAQCQQFDPSQRPSFQLILQKWFH